jgi:hypothetical protein
MGLSELVECLTGRYVIVTELLCCQVVGLVEEVERCGIVSGRLEDDTCVTLPD